MKLLPKVFLIIYLFIIVTPSFGAVDKADSQWLFLSLINIPVLIFNFYNLKVLEVPKAYFLLFILFLFFSLLSLYNSINFIEGLMTSLHYIIFFTTFLNLFLIFIINANFIKFTLYSIVAVLCVEIYFIYLPLIESFNISNRSIFNGTSGNVIISSFSILLKIPILLYLLVTQNSKYIKFILSLLLFLCLCFLLFLSGTRSSFIALLIIFTLFFAFNFGQLNRYFKTISLSIVLSFLSLTYVYSERLLLFLDSSVSARFRYYSQAIEVFLDSPFIGVGVGNWQIASLLKDRLYIEEYQVPMFVHNDYLQVLAESGFFGFIFFLLLVFYPLYHFRSFASNSIITNLNFYLILSAIIFSIDLFFNFPLSRPTILILYCFIISIYFSNNKNSFISLKIRSKIPFSFLFIVSTVAVVFSIIDFNFSKDQKIILSDFNKQNFTTHFLEVQNFNSDYNLLGPTSIPLSSNLSKYYLENDSISLAISSAKKGLEANPYHSLSLDVLSKSFEKIHKLDSALFYAKKSFEISPRNIASSSQLMVILEKKNMISEIDSVFLSVKDFSHEIDWLNYIKIHTGFKIKTKNEIISLIDNAIKLFPNNQDFKAQKVILENGFVAIETANYFDQMARVEFSKSNFNQAYDMWIKASDALPTEFAYIQNMASCLVNMFSFNEAIDLLVSIPEEDYPNNGKVEFIIGTAYVKLNSKQNACLWLSKGIAKGDSGSLNLYNQICN